MSWYKQSQSKPKIRVFWPGGDKLELEINGKMYKYDGVPWAESVRDEFEYYSARGYFRPRKGRKITFPDYVKWLEQYLILS